MDDGCSNLRLDVIANDWQASLCEALAPVGLASNEDWNAVDEPATGLNYLLDVPLGCVLAADWQVGDDNISLCVTQDLDDVGSLTGRLRDPLLEVLAKAIVGHPAVDVDAKLLGDLRELHRVVLA